MTESVVPAAGVHLTTGWEPDLAHDDTLVRQAVLVHAAWPLAVAASTGRPSHDDDDWAGAWIGDRGAFTNLLILKRPPDDPAAVINAMNELIPASVPYVVVSPWPVDLSSCGLTLIGHPPLMARFPGRGPTRSGDGVDVREVRDVQALATAERILVEGYPMPDLEPLAPGELFGPAILGGATRVWLAYVDDQPAAVSAAHAHAGVVLVEYVAALPVARGRGAGAAVAWAATVSQPELPAILVASDDGRPVYERMGYRAIERWSAWLRLPT